MAVQTVFSSNLDPAAENLTIRFTNATGFYITAPFLNAELEIDVFLQVYFPTPLGEQVRNLPLSKIESQAILLNVTDTQSLVTIPSEYRDTGLEMALLFLASSTTFLQVVVVSPDCSLCELDNRIDALQQQLTNGLNQLTQNQAAMQNTLNQILTIVGADVVIPGTVDPGGIVPVGLAATAANFFIFI